MYYGLRQRTPAGRGHAAVMDFEKDEGETVITGESDKNTVTIDTSEGNVDVTFDDLKIDVSGKKEGGTAAARPRWMAAARPRERQRRDRGRTSAVTAQSMRAKPPSPCRVTTMPPSSWTAPTS